MYVKIINGIACHSKKIIKNIEVIKNINLSLFSLNLKFLNFNENIFKGEISNALKIIVVETRNAKD